jgi:hypothetical protein
MSTHPVLTQGRLGEFYAVWYERSRMVLTLNYRISRKKTISSCRICANTNLCRTEVTYPLMRLPVFGPTALWSVAISTYAEVGPNRSAIA